MSDDIIQKRTRLQLNTSEFVLADGKDFFSFFVVKFLVLRLLLPATPV